MHLRATRCAGVAVRRDYWISCLVNPSAGREAQWGGDRFVAADQSQSVLVVGGGPAGLEAARVAAERGHRVTLVEAETVLGGASRYAGKRPRRGQIVELLAWSERQLGRSGSTSASTPASTASRRWPSASTEIVVATGSGPARTGFQRRSPGQDALPGVERPGVLAVEDVMSGRAEIGRRVVVLDDTGDWRGGGTAWHLAKLGHSMLVITGYPLLGFHLQRSAADGTLRTGAARRSACRGALTRWRQRGPATR